MKKEDIKKILFKTAKKTLEDDGVHIEAVFEEQANAIFEELNNLEQLSDNDINKNFPIYGDNTEYQKGCRYGAKWARDKKH